VTKFVTCPPKTRNALQGLTLTAVSCAKTACTIYCRRPIPQMGWMSHSKGGVTLKGSQMLAFGKNNLWKNLPSGTTLRWTMERQVLYSAVQIDKC
jgi:hypothetical protein